MFANVLQENVRAGFPTKNFFRMNNAKTRETMLQLPRDASMGTAVDTAASFYRTAPAPPGRPKTAAHHRAVSDISSAASGPWFTTAQQSSLPNRLQVAQVHRRQSSTDLRM